MVWVVGAGGLLGSALVRELAGDAFQARAPLTWADRPTLLGELAAALAEFGTRLEAEPERPWAVAWCAGLGIVGTSAQVLAAETATLSAFLDLIAGHDSLTTRAGGVLLASSAGGVYAGSNDSPITEASAPRASSDYGAAKLAQEGVVSGWARARGGRVSALIARVSNVYGPGQRLEKQQGLISHLARCSIYGVPVHIYVSLDTVRDYLFAQDAARRLCEGVRRLLSEACQPGSQVTKIYASESEVSISGLLGIFREVARQPLQVVFGLHPSSAQQAANLRFRSQVWVPEPAPQLELVQGIRLVYRAQLELFERGLLPAPPPLGRD